MGALTELELRQMIRARGEMDAITVPPGTLITPAARQFLRERRIQLRFGEPAGPAPGAAPSDGAAASVARLVRDAAGADRIPVGVSGRHVHLSPEHVEVLFGPGAGLTPDRPLSQPGQFACRERVLIAGPRGAIPGVRVLGPARGATQVEISATDAIALGVQPPVRESGRHEGSASLTLVGPAGSVAIPSGVILARRHIHMTPEDARRFGVADGETVWVAVTEGPRRMAFGDVLVRVSPRYRLEFHIDTDEANAAGLRTGDTVVLIKP